MAFHEKGVSESGFLPGSLSGNLEGKTYNPLLQVQSPNCEGWGLKMFLKTRVVEMQE